MIAERLNAERVVLLGWSRAILLQLAHPLVAAGVAEHSTFRDGGVTAALRLHQTVRAMLSLTFGSDAQRSATLAHINAIHQRVNGVLARTVGPFAAGTRYSAEDPKLLLWVHATLLESIPIVYEMLIAPLSAAERDQYCREAGPIVRALGASDGVPESWAQVRAYMDGVYASGQVAVGSEARAIADAVLAPPLAWMLGPIPRINRLFTVGLLPPAIRDQYEFEWSDADARALARWTRVIGKMRSALPDRLALWPEARATRS